MEDAWTVAMWTKALPVLVVSLTSLIVGWVFGMRITSYWDSVKKRGTEEIEAAERFYRLYGEFYAVWKLWSVHVDERRYLVGRKRDPETTWDLLKRAAEVEGGFEALLVRVTQERELSDDDIDTLARFREGVQCLRESIRVNEPLDWKANPTKGEPAAKYLAFKILANRVSDLLSDKNRTALSRRKPPSQAIAETHLVNATRVDHRRDWWKLPHQADRSTPALNSTGAGQPGG